MNTVVVFKWLRNPADARVSADGSVDWGASKPAPSDDDPEAAAVAATLAAAGDGTCIGVTVGDGDVAWAAARGAASTIVVTDAVPGPDASATAEILAAAVRAAGSADVVVVGDSAWDRGVPVALAGALGWAAIADVQAATLEGDRLRVTRRHGDGSQVLDVATPVVLAVAASRAEEHVPGMKDVLVARKKPVVRMTRAELGVPAAAVVVARGTRLPDVGASRVIDGSDPARAAAELVAALRAEGVL